MKMHRIIRLRGRDGDSCRVDVLDRNACARQRLFTCSCGESGRRQVYEH